MGTGFVKAFVHDGSMYLNTHWVRNSEVESYIREWKEGHFEKAQEIGADHFIYMTKSYDENGVFDQLDLYCVPLTDQQFNERVNNLLAIKDAYIGAWHKGTNY